MPRVQPKSEGDLAEFKQMFGELEEFFGFLPNDYLTMGRKPALLAAVGELTKVVVFGPGQLPMSLRLLVPYISSRAAGCMYCIAHCAVLADRHGIEAEKIANIHSYATHPSFTPAERAALRVAERANYLPNAVTDEDFNELRLYFDDDAIVEIVALISMMAFYNRWNDTMATSLERPAWQYADRTLGQTGWTLSKHG